MKKIRRFFGLLLVGTFFLGGTVAASCPSAPASCYFAKSDTFERWLGYPGEGKTLPSHCTDIGGSFANPHKIDFNEVSNNTEVCELIEEGGSFPPCPGKADVSALQSIIASKIGIDDFESDTISRDGFNLNCRTSSFLSDGKYGHCTQHAFGLYLEETCRETSTGPEVVEDCRGEEYELFFDADDTEHTSEYLQAQALCDSFGIETCDETAISDIENGLSECRHLIVIGAGDEPDLENIEPDGSLRTCHANFAIAFENGQSSNAVPMTSFCKKMGLTHGDDCSLAKVIEKIPTEYKTQSLSLNPTTPEDRQAIADALTLFLVKDCDGDLQVRCDKQDKSFRLPAVNPNTVAYQKNPSIFSLLAANTFAQSEGGSELFVEPEVCEIITGKGNCTIAEINTVINKNEHKDLVWNKQGSDGISSSIVEAANDSECKMGESTAYDACMRLGIARYLLLITCTDSDDIIEPGKYGTFAACLSEGTCSTVEKCGGKANFDPETFQCRGGILGIDEDHLRPKYLSGANYGSRRYSGDGTDITYWLQKLGGKVTNYIAALAVLFIAYNGFMIVTAAGDKDQISKARQGIIWAAAGLVLLAFSYVIVKTVVSLAY